MKCKNTECNRDAKGNGKYCSATCKTVFNRNKKRNKKTAVTPVTPAVTPEKATVTSVTPVTPVTASLEHYQQSPQEYAKRTNAALLNWGEPMSSPELVSAKLTANRVAIPGDWDHTHPAPLPEPTKKPTPSATQGTQPTGQPNTNTAKLTAAEIGLAIGSYSGLDWIDSAEYAELILRLSTWSLKKLKEHGHVVPQWRHELK
jgi:hypothetical protein